MFNLQFNFYLFHCFLSLCIAGTDASPRLMLAPSNEDEVDDAAKGDGDKAQGMGDAVQGDGDAAQGPPQSHMGGN
jgi:hypothetical protein